MSVGQIAAIEEGLQYLWQILIIRPNSDPCLYTVKVKAGLHVRRKVYTRISTRNSTCELRRPMHKHKK